MYGSLGIMEKEMEPTIGGIGVRLGVVRGMLVPT